MVVAGVVVVERESGDIYLRGWRDCGTVNVRDVSQLYLGACVWFILDLGRSGPQ